MEEDRFFSEGRSSPKSIWAGRLRSRVGLGPPVPVQDETAASK